MNKNNNYCHLALTRARAVRYEPIKGKSVSTKYAPRSDKGQPRPAARGEGTKTKLATYAQLKGVILHKEADKDQPDYVLGEDVNHIFPVMVKHNHAVYGNYTVVNRGKKIARTVKHVQGYETDLKRGDGLRSIN